MGVLRFNSGSMKWTTLQSALSNVSAGAWTAAWVMKRFVDDANFHGQTYLLSSTGNGVTEAGASVRDTDELVCDFTSPLPQSTFTVTGTTETYLLVAGKASGSTAATFSRYVKSTDTWTHDAASQTAVDQTAATMLEIGAWEAASDQFNGWMGVVGWWSGNMSNANRALLSTNWRTSDLWTSAHGQPVFLAELNTTTPTDLAGNASSRTTTGTAPTLDGAESLVSWGFDGTGAPAVEGPKLRTVQSTLRW